MVHEVRRQLQIVVDTNTIKVYYSTVVNLIPSNSLKLSEGNCIDTRTMYELYGTSK